MITLQQKNRALRSDENIRKLFFKPQMHTDKRDDVR
jgi:hypothetical protein